MKENNMSPEKSLKIISEAIAKSRRDFEKNAGTPLITWGCIVLIFSLLIWFVLRETKDLFWNVLWVGVPIIGWPLSHAQSKATPIENANGFINKLLGNIWITYGIFATTLTAAFAFIAPPYGGFITAVLLGFAATITGIVLKNNCMKIGGIVTGIGCTIALFYIEKWDASLLFAFAAIVNLITPGIIMNRKAKQRHV